MKRFVFLTAILVSLFGGFLLAGETLAGGLCDSKDEYCLDKIAVTSELKFFEGSIPKAVGRFLGTGLALVGILFFILAIYGGVLWMTAHGNDEQAKKALQTLVSAIIGLIIILSSYTLTQFVFGSLAGDSGRAGEKANKAAESPSLSEQAENTPTGDIQEIVDTAFAALQAAIEVIEPQILALADSRTTLQSSYLDFCINPLTSQVNLRFFADAVSRDTTALTSSIDNLRSVVADGREVERLAGSAGRTELVTYIKRVTDRGERVNAEADGEYSLANSLFAEAQQAATTRSCNQQPAPPASCQDRERTGCTFYSSEGLCDSAASNGQPCGWFGGECVYLTGANNCDSFSTLEACEDEVADHYLYCEWR